MRTLVITPWSAGEEAKAGPGAESHHRLVMDGVRAVWGQWGRPVLEVAVFSTESGLLHAEAVDLGRSASPPRFGGESRAGEPAPGPIQQRVVACAGAYDLVFYLLWGLPFAALRPPLDLPGPVRQILLTGQEEIDLLSPVPNSYPVLAAGTAAARRWHIKSPHVCGFLFRRLCSQVAYHGPLVLEWLAGRPQDTEKLFYKRARWRPQWRLWEDGG